MSRPDAFVDYDTHFSALTDLATEFSPGHYRQARLFHEFLFKPDFSEWSPSEFECFVNENADRTGTVEAWRLMDDALCISRFQYGGSSLILHEFERLAERGRRILCGFHSCSDTPESFEFETESIDWLTLLHEHGRFCPSAGLQARWHWWNPGGLPLTTMTNDEIVAFRSDYTETPTGSFPSHPIVSSLQQDVFPASTELIHTLLDSPDVVQVDYWEEGYPSIFLPSSASDLAATSALANPADGGFDPCSDIEIIEDKFTFCVSGTPCKCGNTNAFRILRFLSSRFGKYVPSDELFEPVWGKDFVKENTVHQAMTDVRRRLERAGVYEVMIDGTQQGHYALQAVDPS